MANSPLMELMTDQLRDLYDAEKQLTKALPRMAKAANDKELADGFREHASQTQEQARRIERIFESMGMKARGKPCEAMKGLIAEGQEAMSDDIDESVRDLALLAAARRVEHYETAAYDALIAGAQAARQSDAAGLLKQTLNEETATDKKLAAIAKRLLKEVARSGRGAASADGAQRGRGQASSPKGRAQSVRAQGRGNGHLSNTTTDHDEIQRWAEERGGRPACVMGTGGKGDIGMLRLEFPGRPNAKDDKLTEISWEEFFDKFDERGLALVYQEQTARGQKSNFNKLISREPEAKPKTRAAG